MLDLNSIKKQYPKNLWSYPRFLLKEYLQYKILQAVFSSKFQASLCFLGGTALRIVHNNGRFSEDLDFDNFGLDQVKFEALVSQAQKKLELEGIKTEYRNVYKGVYRSYLKFPNILNVSGLSPLKDEKILIQLDTYLQKYKYPFDKVILNKFDIFTQINVAPSDILLAKKIVSAVKRKSLKGRDFFDIVFLFAKTEPNYPYLEKKIQIANARELKKKLLEVLNGVDLKVLAKDVGPFLFNENEIGRVLLFREFLESLK